jgi:tetratricopeptide (TPR) repeat protein
MYFDANNKSEEELKYSVESLKLRPFDEEMMKRYFALKSEILGIVDNVSNTEAFGCIQILTDRKPIMIDAITELIVRDGKQSSPLNFLQTKFDLFNCVALARHKTKKLKDKQEEFNKRSIEHLNVGDNDFEKLSIEEKAVVYLHFLQVMDKKFMKELLPDMSEQHFENIQKLVYTKALRSDYVTLHDKMRDLLAEHLGSFTDGFTYELYQKAENILKKKLSESQTDASQREDKYLKLDSIGAKLQKHRIQKWQLDTMRLTFLIDEINDKTKLAPTTFTKYSQMFNDAKLAGEREFILELYLLAEEHTEYMDDDQKIQHIIYEADTYTLNNKPLKSIKRLEKLSTEFDEKLLQKWRVDIDNTLANSYGYLGNLKKAYELQNGVYQKLQGDLQKSIFVQNHIGNLLLQMTKYADAQEHLKKVIQNIKKLFNETKEDEFFQSKKAFESIEAFAYSHLSNIYRVNGEYEEALFSINKADKIWESMGSIHNINLIGGIGFGDIYRSQGQIQRSTMEFGKAQKEIKTNVNDKHEVGLNISVALQYLFESGRHTTTNRDELLNKAQKLCEDSLEECYETIDGERTISFTREYVEVLGCWSHILIEKKDNPEAIKMAQEQYKVAKESDIPFYQLDAVATLAELNEDVSAYDDEIETIKKDYGEIPAYSLILGRLKRIEADKFFEKARYEQAFWLYAEAIFDIDRHQGYYVYTIHDELDRISKKLEMLAKEKEHYFELFTSKLKDLQDIRWYSKAVTGWIKSEKFEL